MTLPSDSSITAFPPLREEEKKAVELSDGCYRVPMSALLDYLGGDPFEKMVWDCPEFTREEVLSSVALEEEISIPYDEDVQDAVVGQSSYHISRIAYLFRHGWDESGNDFHTPILEVSFGYDAYDLGRHPLLDGNHRLAAAVLRGDEFFTVYVDGDLDRAEEMFGI